jgi:uncharacterized protein
MLYKINKKGIVVNEARRCLIQRKYKPVLEKISSFYLKELGNNLLSIYVRGSVSVGRARLFISDVDSIAITRKVISKKDLKAFLKYSREVQKKYPFVTLVDMTVISLEELLTKKEFSNLKIYLKTQSICLYGKDIVKNISEVRPGKTLAISMYGNLSEQLNELSAIFSGKKIKKIYLGEKRSIEFWCIWTMRLILRSGLGLVMIKKPLYSQDLGTCLKVFSKNYPKYKKYMEKALFLALNPTQNKKQIYNYLNDFSPKLIKLWKEEINN